MIIIIIIIISPSSYHLHHITFIILILPLFNTVFYSQFLHPLSPLPLSLPFQGAIKNPFNPLCSALDLDNWILSYDRLLIRTVRNISGGIVVVTAAATDIELVFEAEPTSQVVFFIML